MTKSKTKIVLDADVINHFIRGGKLDLLPKIFPNCQFVVLDVVKREIPDLLLSELMRQINLKKSFSEEVFGKTAAEKKEYARLTASTGPALGKGESACMVYCRFNNDVVGSSNTRDVTNYCEEHGITFLTTNDFLYYAIKNNLMTVNEAHSFIQVVISNGSNPKVEDFNTYICTKIVE